MLGNVLTSPAQLGLAAEPHHEDVGCRDRRAHQGRPSHGSAVAGGSLGRNVDSPGQVRGEQDRAQGNSQALASRGGMEVPQPQCDGEIAGNRRRDGPRQPRPPADGPRVGQRQGDRRNQSEETRFGHLGRGGTSPFQSAKEQDDGGRARKPEDQAARARPDPSSHSPKPMDNRNEHHAFHEEFADHGCTCSEREAADRPAGRMAGILREGRAGGWLGPL
jgi:hypothetical protein